MTRGTIGFKSVNELARRYDEKLTAMDFGNTSVQVIVEDGSILYFDYAFARIYFAKPYDEDADYDQKYKDAWLMVFTEHHGFHVFHVQDLHGWKQFERKDIDSITDEELGNA